MNKVLSPIKQSLIVFGSLIIAFGITYLALEIKQDNTRNYLQSSAYITRDPLRDALLAALSQDRVNQLDTIIATVATRINTYTSFLEANAYIDHYLSLISAMDDAIKNDPAYEGTYKNIFTYIYPRIYELRRTPYNLSITKGGSGSGSVFSSGNTIDCASNCISVTTAFASGTTIRLNATKTTGSSLAGWSGCDEQDSNFCYVNMSSDRAVKVIFTKIDDMVCTDEYAPTCGQSIPYGFTCPTDSDCNIIKRLSFPLVTYSNSCAMHLAGATLVNTGSCLGTLEIVVNNDPTTRIIQELPNQDSALKYCKDYIENNAPADSSVVCKWNYKEIWSHKPNETYCTKEYAPVCGQPPIYDSCIGLVCTLYKPSPMTYSNTCMMQASGATLVNTGVCVSTNTLSCATKPTYLTGSNTTFITGSVAPTTVEEQAWQNTSSGSPCYYSCKTGYHGTTCTADASANETLVRKYYQEILLREPDNGGLSYWKSLVDSGSLDSTTLPPKMACIAKDNTGADGTNSRAWLTSKNITCETTNTGTGGALVRKYYLEILDREPDIGGFDYWKAQVDSGSLNSTTLPRFMACVAKNGSEGADKTNATSWLSRNNIDCSGTTTTGTGTCTTITGTSPSGTGASADLVRQNYRDIVCREGDQGGFDYWKTRVDSGSFDSTTLPRAMACAAQSATGADKDNSTIWLNAKGISCTSAGGTCTNFTYSGYGACQADNTQTRTILTSSPSGCTGGTPASLTGSCTYTGGGGGTCSGTLPTGSGVTVRAVYPDNTTGQNKNTTWIHYDDLDAGRYQGCTWQCAPGFTRNGNIGCLPRPAGDGITITVLDATTNQPITGVSIPIIQYYGNSYTIYRTLTTNVEGKTTEFFWPYVGTSASDTLILNANKNGYSIMRSTTCTSTGCTSNGTPSGVSYRFPLGTSGEAVHSVTLYMSNGTTSNSSTPNTFWTDINLTQKSQFTQGESLYGYIDGGDPANTWACLDGPSAGNDCIDASKYRRLTAPVNGVADGWQINSSNGRIELSGGLALTGYPAGLYTGYARTGQNGTSTSAQFTVSTQSNSNSIIVTNIGDWVFDTTGNNPTDSRRSIVTNAGTWNEGAGTMQASMDFISEGYFQNSGAKGGTTTAHIAIVLRNDLNKIGTAVFGQGMILGDVHRVTPVPADVNRVTPGSSIPNLSYPSTQIETWFNGIGNGNYLLDASNGSADKLLRDYVNYHIIVDATKKESGDTQIRYRLYRYAADGTTLILEKDTGNMSDGNKWFDPSKTGFTIGEVLASKDIPWKFTFKNIVVKWGPVGME